MSAGDINSQEGKFGVQRDFQRKYPEYECYIAVGSDFDLVADTDSDHVPSYGCNGSGNGRWNCVRDGSCLMHA